MSDDNGNDADKRPQIGGTVTPNQIDFYVRGAEGDTLDDVMEARDELIGDIVGMYVHHLSTGHDNKEFQ